MKNLAIAIEIEMHSHCQVLDCRMRLKNLICRQSGVPLQQALLNQNLFYYCRLHIPCRCYGHAFATIREVGNMVVDSINQQKNLSVCIELFIVGLSDSHDSADSG